MANRLPLTANKNKKRIEELPIGDYLDLTQSGIVSATSIQSQYFYGSLVGVAQTSVFLTNAANILSGTISSSRLSGTYGINITGKADYLSRAENILDGIINPARLDGQYNIDISGTSTTSTNVIGGIGSITTLRVSGISTLGSVQISSGIITATSGIVTYYGDGSKLNGVGPTLSTSTSSSTNYVTFVSGISTTSIEITQTNLTFVPSTGNLSAVQFTSLSDRNEKKNIQKIENAIEIINQLEGVRFDWINNNKPSIGVIAQDIEKILPEVVETADNGRKSVSYGNIIGVLIEAIKEQQIRIEELEKKINA